MSATGDRLDRIDSKSRSLGELTLEASLIARIGCNAIFARFLVSNTQASLSEIASALLMFALLDGAFAGAVAVSYGLVAPRDALWLPAALDAVTRFVLGALLQFGPGIPSFPVTAVLFVALVATFAAADGFADVVEGVVIRTAYGRGMGGLSLSIAGGTSTIAGVALFLSTMHAEQLTLLLAIVSLAHVLAGIGAARRAHVLLKQIRRRAALSVRPSTS